MIVGDSSTIIDYHRLTYTVWSRLYWVLSGIWRYINLMILYCVITSNSIKGWNCEISSNRPVNALKVLKLIDSSEIYNPDNEIYKFGKSIVDIRYQFQTF